MSANVIERFKFVEWQSPRAFHIDAMKLVEETTVWFTNFDEIKVYVYLKPRKLLSEIAGRIHPFSDYDRVLLSAKFYVMINLWKFQINKNVSWIKEHQEKIIALSKKNEIEEYDEDLKNNLPEAMFSDLWVQLCKKTPEAWRNRVIEAMLTLFRKCEKHVQLQKENKFLKKTEIIAMSPISAMADIGFLFIEFNENKYHDESVLTNKYYLKTVDYHRVSTFLLESAYALRKLKAEKRRDNMNAVHWYESVEGLTFEDAVDKVFNEVVQNLKYSENYIREIKPLLPNDFEWMLNALRYYVTGVNDYLRNHPWCPFFNTSQ